MLLDPVSGTLERYLTLLSERQSLVASNIANADTPGYKTKDIDFQAELQNAMAGLPPRVEEVPGLTLKNDGNNVSLEREARLLAENTMRFSIASNLLRSQLKLTRMAIEGGGGTQS
jgi:flagellar basal-body rod protein FlgB